jgi:hypothetical protein
MKLISAKGKIRENFRSERAHHPMVRVRYPEHLVRKTCSQRKTSRLWLVGLLDSELRWSHKENLASEYASPRIAISVFSATKLSKAHVELVETHLKKRTKVVP